MTRDTLSIEITDLSKFTRSLRSQLPELNDKPSHVEMLSLVARAAGYRNYQHLRARNSPSPKADRRRVARAAAHFDNAGHLLRWPGKTAIQALCLWVLWARLPARQTLSEREISQLIDTQTLFRDAAQIRRGMVEHGLVTRNLDGSAYQRVEQASPPEARALMVQFPRREV